MIRRRPVALVVAAMAGLLVACQAAPPPTTLTDPREILAAAATTTAAAQSVRIDATADGTLSLDLLGLGAPSPVELTGTTVSADLDIDGGDARATFSAPGLLGLTGEVIALDGTGYYKTTLTGQLYQQQSLGAEMPAASGAAGATILKGLTDLLSNPTLRPVKGDDAECGGTTCYRVDIALTSADLAALGAGDLQAPTGLPIPIPIPDLAAATLDLQVLVAKDSTRLMGINAALDLGGGAGVATVSLTFSKWDEAVSIAAPPPDQVAPAN